MGRIQHKISCILKNWKYDSKRNYKSRCIYSYQSSVGEVIILNKVIVCQFKDDLFKKSISFFC